MLVVQVTGSGLFRAARRFQSALADEKSARRMKLLPQAISVSQKCSDHWTAI
jgi:hypothetical protein